MDLSPYEHIEFRREGDVLVMTLNRPERLGARRSASGRASR